MIEPSIFIVLPNNEHEEITVEELSAIMHNVLKLAVTDVLIIIGDQQKTAKEWQDDYDWADAIIDQRSSTDLVLVSVCKPKRWGRMTRKEFMARLRSKEVSVEKLVSSTGTSVKGVANFFYRFSAATAIEGTLWAGARCGTKMNDFCQSKLSSLKDKAARAM